MTTFFARKPNNQAPVLENDNLFTHDLVLRESLQRYGAAWAEDKAATFGARCGSTEVRTWGRLANEYSPKLVLHDRFGTRVDEVEFHPAWHSLMQLGVENGLHSMPWEDTRAGSHVARAALFFMLSQIEAGCGCPLSMSFAGVPALMSTPPVASEWLPLLTTRSYDFGVRPNSEKAGVLCGMAMTEKQGGSDVRANITEAKPLTEARSPGSPYELWGHKWFCSAPMNDIFLVLAQTTKGVSCFLLPRVRPDGSRNAMHLVRLKDKLGNRSNASSEVEFHGAYAQLLGEEGRGVQTIVEMVSHTRLDCVIGSAAVMRQALVQALHHARHRSAFGQALSLQPLMQNVLADLALESEAASLLMMWLAHKYDVARRDTSQRPLVRLVTAVSKYWVCKRAPQLVSEALECLGGNGYVEDSGMPRLFRESPLNSIWEGSGNVICLDVLRTLQKEPRSCDLFFALLSESRGRVALFDHYVDALQQTLRSVEEAGARRLVSAMALALQAALLLQHSPSEVAESFCRARLGPEAMHVFGTLSPQNVSLFLERALPL
jgi:putative acyl-CoA dehydrogenase